MSSDHHRRSGRSSRRRKRSLVRRIKDLPGNTAQAIADFGRAVVWPIERVVSKSADEFFSATRSFDRVGLFFKRILLALVSLVLWPLRMVGLAAAALLPDSLARLFTRTGRTSRRMRAQTGKSLMRVLEVLYLDSPLRWLGRKTKPLWQPLASLAKFLACWNQTRKYRRGLRALPAALLAPLVLGITTWHVVQGNSRFTVTYKSAVSDALESQNYEAAQLYERKLAQLGVDTKLTEYRTAVALAGDGKLNEAYERMQLLAPTDEPGYVSAHYWIAQQLLSGKLVEPGPEARRLTKVHIDHLATLKATESYQQLLLALWLAQGGEYDKAASMLKPLVDKLPIAAYERLRIDLRLNRPQEARQDARKVVFHMSDSLKKGHQLDAVDYNWWLTAEEVLGNLPKMRSLLQQRCAEEPDDRRLKETLTKVCLRLAAQKLRDPLPDQEQILALWLEAAEIDTSNESLLRLANFLYEDHPPNSTYGQLLVKLCESPQTPAKLLTGLGTEAALAERRDDALKLLFAAITRDEADAVTWNNYGLMLAEGDDAQLEEALRAVNRALELEPNEYRFRETRGQILLRLERWPEAIDDLEYALNGLPELPAIHQSLVVAYTALGQTELASMHRIQAE